MQSSDEINNLYNKNAGYYSGGRPEVLAFCPENCKTVLDVGCGEGNFGKAAKLKTGAEVWGVDISQASIDIAATQLDKAFCGDINRLLADFPDHYFDVIFFNDVLEHIVDPYTLLETITQKLSNKGVIIASIPNVRHFTVFYQLLVKQDFQYTNAGVLDKTHLRFFTKKGMVRLFEEAGYQVQRIMPINKSKSLKPVLFKICTLGLIGQDISYLQYVVTATKPK